MTAGTREVDIRDRSLVLPELGNRSERPVLIRKKRALSERAMDGADDSARDVDGGMGDAFKNFVLQVGNVVGSNEVNEIISVRFARFIPITSQNSASRVARDNVGDAQDNEFHQRLVGWCPTGIYGGVIPTHNHRGRRQLATATLEI